MTTAARYWLIFAVAFLVGKFGMRLVLRGDLWHVRSRVLRWWHGAHKSCAWCGGQYGLTNREALLSPVFDTLVASSLRVCMSCRLWDRWQRARASFAAANRAKNELNR